MEVDINVDGLININVLIAGFETDDEIGCALRLHLAFEKLIEFYIKNTATQEALKFIENTNEYSEKLKRAVLLGLPLKIAEVGKHLGQIRNKMAHEQASINPDKVKVLIKSVDEMLSATEESTPIAKRKMEISAKLPGETIMLGTHGNMYDFMLAAGTAYHCASMIVIKNVMLRKAAEQLTKSTKS